MVGRPQRRLAAIVAADVAGYSRLMARDEEGTLEALRAHRSELIDPLIAEHGGRIANTAGDSLLVEFSSVVDAVRCAVTWQRDMGRRNTTVPGDRRIEFRVGINLGDIVADGDDIHGDGVNIAARLESFAEPGGIALSGSAYDHVQGRIEAAFEDAGMHRFKNMDRPIHVWCWKRTTPPDVGRSTNEAKSEHPSGPVKPSIAVLPFDNMSGDPDQEYFSDGLSEDITTALSRFRSLAVTARNTSFSYKGRRIDVASVGSELNVRYVLEGSVRKAGERVRITAQLIDVQTGNHVWAERYDSNLEDIFDVQDEVTKNIATAIAPEITLAEIERSRSTKADNITAWDLYLRGLQQFHLMSREGNANAIINLDRTISLNPDYVPALAVLSMCHTFNACFRWTPNRREAIETATKLARKAVAIDQGDAQANLALSWGYMFSERMADALLAARLAVDLEPNNSFARYHLAGCLVFLGQTEEALEVLDSVKVSSRRDPWRWLWYMHMVNAQFVAGQLEDAIRTADIGRQYRPGWIGFYTLPAAAAGLLGRLHEAQAHVKTMLSLVPKCSIRRISRYPMFTTDDAIERLLDGLRKAGLPEE